MSDEQYRGRLRNRRLANWSPEQLGGTLGNVIDAAATGLRRRRRAQETWERIAKPEWLPVTGVESVEGGVVVVVVREAGCYEELRRQARPLGQELAQLSPGVRGVRFIMPEDDAEAPGEQGVDGASQ